MGFAVRHLASGALGGWSRYDVPAHDPQIEEVVECELEEWKALTAPTPLSTALARLITEYDRRRAETHYAVPDGPSVTLMPATAEGLLKMLQVATRLVATGQGDARFWIDDGPTGDVAVVLTAQQIVEHAGPYTDAICVIEIWAASKKAEIEASADPLGVAL